MSADAGPTDAHTRAVVAELRATSHELLDGFEARGEAEFLLVTGVVLINEGHAAAQGAAAALANGGAVDAMTVRTLYAPAHECVHMLQLLTTRFVLWTAFELFGLAMTTHVNQQRGRSDAQWLPAVLADHSALQRRLHGRESGISALEVMEAQAVLEGFRGFASVHVQGGLELVLRLAHDRLPTYSRLIEAMLRAHGFELTLEVLPRLCWVALNADDPGRWLAGALQSLDGDALRGLARQSATQTCEQFGMVPARAASSWRLRRPAITEHVMHPLLKGYFDALERETDVEVSLQRGMHPGRQPAGAQVAMSELMPPLAVYRDDAFVLNGPFRDGGWAEAEPLLRLSLAVTRALAQLQRRGVDAQ